MLAALRQGIGTVLYPVQRTLLVPRDLLNLGAEYLEDVNRMRSENADLKRIEIANAKKLQQAEHLAIENARLRELLGARERTATPSVMAEVLYDTRDPYSRRMVLDKGLQHGVLPGQPVIDAHGVVGQVTRVLPLSSEITLLTDRNASIPIEVQRTGQRSIAFGGAAPGLLELRFLSASTDLRTDDVLTTSGLDGVYPPGLPVGRVRADRCAADRRARSPACWCAPIAGIEISRQLLVLLVDSSQLPPPPAPEPPADSRRRR